MWILFRVSLVVFAVLFRFFGSRWRAYGFRSERLGTLPVLVSESRKQTVSVTEYRVQTTCRIYFRIRGESRWTRFCKRIGLGVEFHVGDPEFDEVFYVASDHPAFHVGLKEDPAIRAVLLDLRQVGCAEILSAGTGELRFIFRATPAENLTVKENEEDLAKRFDAVLKKIETLHFNTHLVDRWALPIIVFETVFWAVGAYGLASSIQFDIDNGQSIIRPHEIWFLGGTVGLVVLGVWLFVVGILLRRTARAPLLVADLFLFVYFGVVFGGFQAIADLNRLLDRSEPAYTRALITQRYSEIKRTKRRRNRYYLRLRFANNPEDISEQLRVSFRDYCRMTQGQGVEFTIRQGGLGFAYIEEMNPIPAPAEVRGSPTPAPVPPAALIREWIGWSAPPAPPFGEGVQAWAEVKYPSGRYRQREPLVDGSREGRARYWYDNGQLYSEIPWSKGEKHGCFILYREDSTVEQVLSYRDGKPHGLLTWHDSSGAPNRWVLYRDGEVVDVPEKDLEALASLRPCRPPDTGREDRSAPR